MTGKSRKQPDNDADATTASRSRTDANGGEPPADAVPTEPAASSESAEPAGAGWRSAEGPSLEAVTARGTVSRVPWMGGAGTAPRPARGAVAAARAAAAPAPATGPSVSAPLDRSVAFEDFTTDIDIVVEGKIIAVLRRSAGFPSGRLPGERAQWMPDPTGGSRMCYALSQAAAARCLAAGGWR